MIRNTKRRGSLGPSLTSASIRLRKIQYYKYTSTIQMRQITGMSANGWADPPNFSVHTIFAWQGHEVVHVLTALVGRPSYFFNEGIAVFMQVDPYASDPTRAL